MLRAPPAAFALIAASFTASNPAMAQAANVHWDVMGGYSDTLGTTANYLQGGYIFGVGLSMSPSWMHNLDLRFDVSYDVHNATIALLNSGQQATNQPIDFGSGSILSGSVNLVYHVPIAYGVRAYALAGAGAYYTRIELDQALPFFGGCGYYGCGYGFGYGDGYGEAVVAAHGVTNFGWDAGVGVEFALPYGHSWFLEARYQHVNSTATIQYLPIEVGYRF